MDIINKIINRIDLGLFKQSLGIMGKGMLGIFIVTIILVASIYLLNFIGRKLGKKKDEE